jgi:glucodextranase-like protein/PASTA domain-containing protein
MWRAALIMLSAAALAGCGATERQRPPVRLALDSPGDGAVVRTTTVEVRGTVRPRGATVEVAGRPAQVSAGAFDAIVPLDTGANVIDVAATAPDARPAVTALRVRRDDRVTLPALAGQDPDLAQARLEDLGMTVTRERAGSFFDPLVPAPPRVCAIHPHAGSRVSRGSHVRLVWARHC